MALNGMEGTCFVVQARWYLVCAWNKHMEASIGVGQGGNVSTRKQYHVADTLRHGGAFASS